MRRSEPFGGPLTVEVEGNEQAISRELAERIGVS
jgi:Fe2+ transport system protein FeoA